MSTRYRGPASDYSAIYTGLARPHGISVGTCGESAKTVISLDLDFYEKVYLLVTQNWAKGTFYA